MTRQSTRNIFPRTVVRSGVTNRSIRTTNRLVDETGRLTTDLLSQYLDGVGQFDLLTADEEVQLAQAMEAGDLARRHLEEEPGVGPSERAELESRVEAGRQARQRFIESNLRLVVSNARRYAGGAVDMLDLIQEGNLGLVTAVERFDWRKGFKFSTYATWWIRQAMQRARAHLSDPITIPPRIFDIVPTVHAASAELKSRLGHAPTVEDIAEETGITVADVDRALSVAPTVPLETPVGEEGASLGEFIADEEAIDPETQTELRMVEEAVRSSLNDLPELQRRLLELRFGLGDEPPATVAHISRETGIPAHQIPGLISDTLEQLRGRLEAVEEMRAA